MKRAGPFPFSLPAFLLAPWPAPLILSVLFVHGSAGRQPVAFFFLCVAVGLVISYLGTASLAIALWSIARVRPVTRLLSALLGIALAAIGYLPFIYLNWSSSGPDSGPPVDRFATHFVRDVQDPFCLAFLVAGLVTAVLYDALTRRNARTPVAS